VAVKFKLDENLDARLVSLLREGDHDADTVLDQRLSGQSDEIIYKTCCKSGHTLITLDLDYSNPLRFPPESSEGIVVLRPPQPVLPILRSLLASALAELKTRSLKGKLWIIEPGRIRIYEPEDLRDKGTVL
jgi:predicted nuclease of predicted toxin-antitoxin system